MLSASSASVHYRASTKRLNPPEDEAIPAVSEFSPLILCLLRSCDRVRDRNTLSLKKFPKALPSVTPFLPLPPFPPTRFVALPPTSPQPPPANTRPIFSSAPCASPSPSELSQAGEAFISFSHTALCEYLCSHIRATGILALVILLVQDTHSC